MSILRDLAARNRLDDVVFLHAARSARDLIFRGELDRMARSHSGLRLATVLEDGAGRLDAARLFSIVPDLPLRDTWLCGPQGMMDALAPIWTESGITPRLKIER